MVPELLRGFPVSMLIPFISKGIRMKNILKTVLIGAALTLAACAHEERPDFRFQSFQAADKDHNNVLSYGEYKTYLDLQAGHGDMMARDVVGNTNNPEKSYLKAFQRADLNNDTFVSREELSLY